MASGLIISWQIEGETVRDFIFGGSKITADGDCSHEMTLAPWKKSYDQPRQHIKKQRHHFAYKSPSSQSYSFSSSHVWMWELDQKKAEHRRTDAFELWRCRRLLKVHWTTRRSNQSILRENQSWIFIERTDAGAETPILWPPDVKSWLIWKDPDVGKDWRQEEKGMTEDEMVRWHHQLNEHEFG